MSALPGWKAIYKPTFTRESFTNVSTVPSITIMHKADAQRSTRNTRLIGGCWVRTHSLVLPTPPHIRGAHGPPLHTSVSAGKESWKRDGWELIENKWLWNSYEGSKTLTSSEVGVSKKKVLSGRFAIMAQHRCCANRNLRSKRVCLKMTWYYT